MGRQKDQRFDHSNLIQKHFYFQYFLRLFFSLNPCREQKKTCCYFLYLFYPKKRKRQLLGHKNLATTEFYTHVSSVVHFVCKMLIESYAETKFLLCIKRPTREAENEKVKTIFRDFRMEFLLCR